MVNETQDLHDFVFSQKYQESLDEICQRTGISIYEQYNDVILKFDKDRVEMSDVSLHDIEALVQAHDNKFVDFCVAKIEFSKKYEEKQEFPKGEEVEEFDQNEQILGFSRGILLMYAIEFVLGLKGSQYLDEYVKKARIPSAKKYVKNIIDLIKLSA